jgi:hypothetical protein
MELNSPAYANLAGFHVEDVGCTGITRGEIVILKITHCSIQ